MQKSKGTVTRTLGLKEKALTLSCKKKICNKHRLKSPHKMLWLVISLQAVLQGCLFLNIKRKFVSDLLT